MMNVLNCWVVEGLMRGTGYKYDTYYTYLDVSRFISQDLKYISLFQLND